MSILKVKLSQLWGQVMLFKRGHKFFSLVSFNGIVIKTFHSLKQAVKHMRGMK